MTNWKPIIRAAFELGDGDWELATKLRSLTEPERELLMNALGPPAKSVKKSSTAKKRDIQHCDACDYTKRHTVHKDQSRSDYHEFQPKKSARAQSLSEQMQKSRSATGGLPKGVSVLCVYKVDDNGGLMECGEPADANLHHLSTHPDYHPFVAPVATAASKSSRQSTLTESVANSETVEGTAGNAVHGASGGD